MEQTNQASEQEVSVNLGGIDFQLREFTNSERLLVAAYANSVYDKKARKRLAIGHQKAAMMPKHPIEAQVEKEIAAKEQEYNRYKESLLPQEMLDNQKLELEELPTKYTDETELTSKRALMIIKQSKAKIDFVNANVPEDVKNKHLMDVYNIKQRIPAQDKQKIAEDKADRVEIEQEIQRALDDTSVAQLGMIYFMRFGYQSDLAEIGLSAESQLETFYETMQENDRFLEWLEAIKQERHSLDGNRQEDWATKASKIVQAGNGSGSIQQALKRKVQDQGAKAALRNQVAAQSQNKEVQKILKMKTQSQDSLETKTD